MSRSPDTFTYKGYIGSAGVSHEDECLIGKILHIDDLIMYDGLSYGALKRAFKKSVDEYLAVCAKVGKEPQKSYSGNLNVRIGSAAHSDAARAAQKEGIALNEYIKLAVEARNTATLIVDLHPAEQFLAPIIKATATGYSVTVVSTIGTQAITNGAASSETLHMVH